MELPLIVASAAVLVVIVLAYQLVRASRQPSTKEALRAAKKFSTPPPGLTLADAGRLPPIPALAPMRMPVGLLPSLHDAEDDLDLDPTSIRTAASEVTHGAFTALDDDTSEPSPGPLVLKAEARSDQGKRRRRNEDRLLVSPSAGLFAVADGMGGHRGGEIASQLAIEELEKELAAETHEPRDKDGSVNGGAQSRLPPPASDLVRAIGHVNDAVRKAAGEDSALKGMGTTLSVLRFTEAADKLYVAHVGDSRVYRLRDGKLAQLTTDHTLRELGVAGDAAANLSRAVGIWETIPVDIVVCRPRAGDLYLVCSDGLTKMVDDKVVEGILTSHADLSVVVDQLVATANEQGGLDNISAIVVRAERMATSA